MLKAGMGIPGMDLSSGSGRCSDRRSAHAGRPAGNVVLFTGEAKTNEGLLRVH